MLTLGQELKKEISGLLHAGRFTGDFRKAHGLTPSQYRRAEAQRADWQSTAENSDLRPKGEAHGHEDIAIKRWEIQR